MTTAASTRAQVTVDDVKVTLCDFCGGLPGRTVSITVSTIAQYRACERCATDIASSIDLRARASA